MTGSPPDPAANSRSTVIFGESMLGVKDLWKATLRFPTSEPAPNILNCRERLGCEIYEPTLTLTFRKMADIDIGPFFHFRQKVAELGAKDPGWLPCTTIEQLIGEILGGNIDHAECLYWDCAITLDVFEDKKWTDALYHGTPAEKRKDRRRFEVLIAAAKRSYGVDVCTCCGAEALYRLKEFPKRRVSEVVCTACGRSGQTDRYYPAAIADKDSDLPF